MTSPYQESLIETLGFFHCFSSNEISQNCPKWKNKKNKNKTKVVYLGGKHVC